MSLSTLGDLALAAALALSAPPTGAPSGLASGLAAPCMALLADALLVAQEDDSPAFAARAVGPIAAEGGLLAGDAGKVTFGALDEVILWRDGKSPNGQAALRQLLELRTLEALAKSEGVVVTQKMLMDRYDELDVEARQSGIEGGLAKYIESQGVDPTEFKKYLRLGIIHETLTRRGLGIPDDKEVTGDQQQLWLEKTLKERGYEEKPHPWTEGIVCVSGDVVITREEFSEYLREQVEDADEREACYLILLERAVRARMPEVTSEGANKALDREVARRAAEAEADPRYQGVSYEQLLDARGLSLEAVRRDPAIRAAALAHEAIDRAHDDDSLRAVYEAERRLFDGRHGEAVELRILFMNAADREGDRLRDPYPEVAARLVGIKAAIKTPADFAEKVEMFSEDRGTRENGGLIGQLTRAGDNEHFEELRDAAFAAVDADPETHGKGRVVGPVRITNGAVIALIGDRTPSPTWGEMSEFVHKELRRRFLEETLDRDAVVTYLDVK